MNELANEIQPPPDGADWARVAQALRQERDRLQQYLDVTGVMLLALDAQQRVTLINRRGCEILGCAEQEVVGKNWFDHFIPPQDRDRVRAVFEQILAGQLEAAKYFENAVLARDGTCRNIAWHNALLRDAQGRIVGTLSSGEDVTRRAQAEAALRRERDLIARLMETSPAGIVVANREGQITFANARAEQILGLTRDKLTQRSYNAPEWRSTDYAGNPWHDEAYPFVQVMKTGQPVYDVRHAIEWPDGRRVLLSINGAPLRNDAGELDGVVFAVEDVTERVQAEQARVAQLARELAALGQMSNAPPTAVTAQTFGLLPLRQSQPAVFDELAKRYAQLIEQALERRVYKVDIDISDQLRALAGRMGQLRAGPRDVIELHTLTLKAKCDGAAPPRAQAVAEEGRLLALELMGHLVLYYRQRSIFSYASQEQRMDSVGVAAQGG